MFPSMSNDGKLEEKWEGKVKEKLKGATAEQVWPLVDDFFGLHKWDPGVDTCRKVEGPGPIRYCESTVTLEPTGEIAVKWVKERLIETDQIGRRVKYEVLENNVGFNHWIVTIEVVSEARGQNSSCGCEIQWSFVGDPVQGWTYQDVVSYYEFSLRSIAEKMEHVLLSPTSEN